MIPAVAVEIAPESAAPAESVTAANEALLSACSSALKRGSCQFAKRISADQSVSATATVVWESSGDSVRVEVKLAMSPGSANVLRRDLSFAHDDALIERWRAVGLSVASLVGGAELGSAAEPRLGASKSDAVPQIPERLQQAPAASEKDRATDVGTRTDVSLPLWWVGLGATVGPGTTSDAARSGVRLEIGVALDAPVYALASFGYAVGVAGVGDLDTAWMTTRAGVLYFDHLVSSGIGLGVSAGVLAQRLEARASVMGEGDSGSQWDPGVSVGLRAVLPASDVWAFSVGADAWRLWRGAEIRLHDEQAALSPPWGVSAWVGVRWNSFSQKESR
jgi:hypothetical protein